jgi:hypothetical protein
MPFKKLDITPRKTTNDSLLNRTQVNQPPTIPKPKNSPPPQQQKSSNIDTSTNKKDGK